MYAILTATKSMGAHWTVYKITKTSDLACDIIDRELNELPINEVIIEPYDMGEDLIPMDLPGDEICSAILVWPL